MKYLSILCLFALLGGMFLSCNDPTIVGSDLLDEEGLNVDFTDTLDIRMKTITGDSIRTLTDGVSTQTVYMLGELDDPFLGYSKTGVYTEIHLNNTIPDYEEAVLDSAVLFVSYDTLGFYGDSLESFDINVFPLMDALADYESLYTDDVLEHEPSPIGTLNGVVINKRDSVSIYNAALDSFVLTRPHLRIPIDNNWAEQIMMDTSAINSDSALVALTKGLCLKADALSDGGYIGLKLGSSTFTSNLIFYYTQSDTLKTSYEYRLSGRRHINIQHDYTGSPAGEALEDYVYGDSLVYLQSMAGVNAEIDLSELTQLGDVLINKAELEFTFAELEEDNTEIYPPIANLVASKKFENDSLSLINDVITAINFGNINFYFGGNLEEIEDQEVRFWKYTMSITNFAIKVLAGEEDPVIVISASIKSERPNRSIIFGPGHSRYPARLKLTYTSL